MLGTGSSCDTEEGATVVAARFGRPLTVLASVVGWAGAGVDAAEVDGTTTGPESNIEKLQMTISLAESLIINIIKNNTYFELFLLQFQE